MEQLQPAERSRSRCPWCHDGFDAAQAEETCEVCRAPHHAACWAEVGGCVICKGTRVSDKPQVDAPPPGRLRVNERADGTLVVSVPRARRWSVLAVLPFRERPAGPPADDRPARGRARLAGPRAPAAPGAARAGRGRRGREDRRGGRAVLRGEGRRRAGAPGRRSARRRGGVARRRGLPAPRLKLA